jgi:putative ATP-dependent endonuclease of OLD family
MHISRVCIKNYANFKDLDVETVKDIVIVGENKVGKSNFIRALRLVLDPSLSERDRQLGLEHFWDGLGNDKLGETVEVSIELSDFEDDPRLLAILGDCLVATEPMVSRLTYRFEPKSTLVGTPSSLADYEYVIFGGTDEDNLWMPSERRQMPLDVQGALRNAEADLMTWARSPLRPIIEDLTKGLVDQDRQEIQALLDSTQQELSQRPEVQSAAETISERLTAIVGEQHSVPVELGLAPVRVDALLRGLRILIDNGARGIPDASLGTANLLFLALKSLELDKLVAEGERSHTFFAVEEPEAHLHPHIQRLVYRHFLSADSVDEGQQQDADTVTTILTTHSPHIASVAPVKSIVLLRHDPEEDATVATSTATVELTESEESDLQRYIDVTRGELFFARGIIFVEGDAERFLVPAFAKELGIDLDVLGITVCSVAGTNFAPYAKLVCEDGLDIPFVVLTDMDPRSDGAPAYAVGRIRSLLKACGYDADWVEALEEDELWQEGKEEGVFVNDSTLEIELFQEGLGPAMKEVFESSLTFTRRGPTMQGWIDDPSQLDDAKLLSWIEQVGKGRFAQALAPYVVAGTCPAYISDALNFIRDAIAPN